MQAKMSLFCVSIGLPGAIGQALTYTKLQSDAGFAQAESRPDPGF
jgi:hypothetical protein